MDKSKKRLRVYTEQAKVLNTTHWDMDYLSKKDLEGLYEDALPDQAQTGPVSRRSSNGRKALVCVLALTALFLILFFGFRLKTIL